MSDTAASNHYQRMRIRGFDPDRLLEVISGGQLEHFLVRPSACDADVEHWDWDDVSLDRGCYNFEVIVRGEFRQDHVCFGLVDCPSGKTVINGFEISRSDIQVYPEGGDVLYRSSAGTTWTAIQVPREQLQLMAMERFGHSLDLSQRAVVNLHARPEAAGHLTNVVKSILAEGRDDVAPHEQKRICSRLLVGAIVEALGSCPPHRDHTAERKRNLRRYRVVCQAQRWLTARVDPEYDSRALCEAVGVPERTLQLCFRQTAGMSPRAWDRSMRLHEAQRLLSSLRGDSVGVTDVALRCGFNHLGRFAIAYGELFGESPSRTLLRSRGFTADTRSG